jgi:two-component system chemotaxis sensor kinase CheA
MPADAVRRCRWTGCDIRSMTDHDPDFAASFMDDYFAESEEHLTAVRRSLLMLESSVGASEPPAAVLEELFRSFHSLKGISAMVELREAEGLAHETEAYLGAIRRGQLVLSPIGFEALIDAANMLEAVIAARRAQTPIPDIEAQLARLADVFGVEVPGIDRTASPSAADAEVSGGASDKKEGALWNVTFTPSADLVARGIKVDTIRGRLAALGRIEHVLPRVTAGGGISFEFQVVGPENLALSSWRDDGVTYEMISRPLPADRHQRDRPSAGPLRAADAPAPLANIVRVDLARLDDLMRLVGDLVVSRSRLEETLSRVEDFIPSGEWRQLQEETDSIERQLRDLREGVMRVRLVPVAEIFRRMPFVVRDLARDRGKRIRVDLEGQGTEIDKFLIERMMDPVLHLVRNAVSHGIELPSDRVTAGKPPEGTVKLSASTVGESVVLVVSDDGQGMDVQAIANRARAAGLQVPEGALDSRVLLDILCSSGFSTRDEADRGSGRGVGMGVVRDTVQDVGGTLTVSTSLGGGTTFRAVLPLTLAITDALIVHVGDATFAVPQAAVQEVSEVEAGALHAIENNELITHRGTTLPVVRLGRIFSLGSAPRPRMHMIVVGTGLAAVGLLVDRISGQREIVVKTLRDPLVKVQGVSGATELGNGRLVLILDVAALTRNLFRRGTAVRAAI